MILKVANLLGLMLSTAWFTQNPDFEPAILSITLLGTFIAQEVKQKKLAQVPKNNSTNIKIELEKHKSKNTEMYFQKQLEAMKELYKLRSNILPNYRMPDMDWDDACQDIAHDFKEIEEKIENFTTEYFSVISQDIISKLDIAKNCAAKGKFEEPSDLKSYQLADTLWKKIDEATKELKQHVELQTHNKT